MFENTIYSQVIIIDPDMVISPSTASAMYCIVLYKYKTEIRKKAAL